MIFFGEILDKIFQKVPIVFWKNFGVKNLPEYLSIKQKNKISGTSSTFGATRIQMNECNPPRSVSNRLQAVPSNMFAVAGQPDIDAVAAARGDRMPR